MSVRSFKRSRTARNGRRTRASRFNDANETPPVVGGGRSHRRGRAFGHSTCSRSVADGWLLGAAASPGRVPVRGRPRSWRLLRTADYGGGFQGRIAVFGGRVRAAGVNVSAVSFDIR